MPSKPSYLDQLIDQTIKTFDIPADPFKAINWTTSQVVLKDFSTSKVLFDRICEFPDFYSERAKMVIASKYFKEIKGVPESSLKQLVTRVTKQLAEWSVRDGYLSNSKKYERVLNWFLLNQYCAFNSPVWFNGGRFEKPQMSACFINSVEDSMESILSLLQKEGMLFKGGSGTGTNFSSLRGSNESVHGGGIASGPLSFIKALDTSAGAIKSGGATRRAAAMRILNDNHPDIQEFVNAKGLEEKKALALMAAGFGNGIDSDSYRTVAFQNGNNSVRCFDKFMYEVVGNQPHQLINVRDGQVAKEISAKELFHQIAENTWLCGDPGVQFDSTIQSWHTCLEDGRIEASNPCCFIGDTLVDTAEGKITFSDLYARCKRKEPLPFTWSWDSSSNLPVLRQINKVWIAGKAKKLLKLTTDKGLELISTPEHPYMLRDGSYSEARDLKPGQRLKKISRVYDETHGRFTIYHRATEKNPKGQSWQARYIWEQYFGEIPQGKAIHHINEIPTDDRIDNLELIDLVDHNRLHGLGLNNANAYKEVDPRLLVEVWEQIEAIPKKTHKNNPCLVSKQRWNTYLLAHPELKELVPYASYKGIQGMTWEQFESWIEENRCLVNDRVASIEVLDVEETTVYDMEVEGSHNFAVSNRKDLNCAHSIVVHNSEYLFINDSACNLSSINLMRFYRSSTNTFDYTKFELLCKILVLAKETIVDNASYPSEEIERNSHLYRTLGLGYTSLGDLIMSMGLGYDSQEARALCASITSLMTASGYEISSHMAQVNGSFERYSANEKSLKRVLDKHLHYSQVFAWMDDEPNRLKLNSSELEHLKHFQEVTWLSNIKAPLSRHILEIARYSSEVWERTVDLVETHGVRNAQISVLAPTGTISFFMDASTTGIEPVLALMQYKKLVGGGTIAIACDSIGRALRSLGYSEDRIEPILDYVNKHETLEGCVDLNPSDLGVFTTSFKPEHVKDCLSWKAHIDMMASAQPFLSGAISKTCNMTNTASIEEIEDAYMYAWQAGIKCLAIYRDGSKGVQPLNTKKEEKVEVVAKQNKLETDRSAIVHKFEIAGHEGYLTVGMYEDGKPGEIFLKMAKEGSTMNGMADAIAISTSAALQWHCPIDDIVKKHIHNRYEPAGMTRNHQIPFAKSLTDYVFRYLGIRFGSSALKEMLIPNHDEVASIPINHSKPSKVYGDTMVCSNCQGIAYRRGSCYCCDSCGTTSGCS
jgi:ribonucleotide reductase alpha subunit